MNPAALFTALGHPARLAVLEALRAGERPAGDLPGVPRMSQPALSQHLRVLRGARLVAARRDGRRRLYRLDPRGLRGVRDWASRYDAFWRARLEALREHLEGGAGP